MGLMGNGEGHTLLMLTNEESLRLRKFLELTRGRELAGCDEAQDIYNRGVQRGTDRIKAEFDAEQKRKKADRK